MEPHTISQLNYISMTYDSVYGSITSGWKQTEQGFEFQIAIPDNCTAEIRLPDHNHQTLDAGVYRFEMGKTH